MKSIYKVIFFCLFVVLSFSCKKVELEDDIKIGGCTDIDSPLYDPAADYENASCVYAFVYQYEITYHPEEDDGSDWDFLIETDADLILRIFVHDTTYANDSTYTVSTSDVFLSTEKSNQAHNAAAYWTAPENLMMYNKIYNWELVDYDALNSNDIVAIGTFNPLELVNNGKITTIGEYPSGGSQSQLVLHYELQELEP
jgi:hypothetical protein